MPWDNKTLATLKAMGGGSGGGGGSAESVSDDEALDILIEADAVDPVADADGAIYTDKDGNIFIL